MESFSNNAHYAESAAKPASGIIYDSMMLDGLSSMKTLLIERLKDGLASI